MNIGTIAQIVQDSFDESFGVGVFHIKTHADTVDIIGPRDMSFSFYWVTEKGIDLYGHGAMNQADLDLINDAHKNIEARGITLTHFETRGPPEVDDDW